MLSAKVSYTSGTHRFQQDQNVCIKLSLDRDAIVHPSAYFQIQTE
jgi:hypothetical protein